MTDTANAADDIIKITEECVQILKNALIFIDEKMIIIARNSSLSSSEYINTKIIDSCEVKYVNIYYSLIDKQIDKFKWYFRIIFLNKNEIDFANVSFEYINSTADVKIIESVSRKLSRHIINQLYKPKSVEEQGFEQKILDYLANFDDKLQAIVYAPGSSLLKEIVAERDKMKK